MTIPASGNFSEDSGLIERLFDLRVGSCFHILGDTKNFDPISDFQFSSSGRLIFAAPKKNVVKIWDTFSPDGNVYTSFQLGHADKIAAMCFNEDRQDLATVSTSGNVQVIVKGSR